MFIIEVSTRILNKVYVLLFDLFIIFLVFGSGVRLFTLEHWRHLITEVKNILDKVFN